MRIVILCVILLLLVLLSCACVERIPKCPRIPPNNNWYAIVELEPWLVSEIKRVIKNELDDPAVFSMLYGDLQRDKYAQPDADTFITLVLPQTDEPLDQNRHYAIGDPLRGPNTARDGSRFYALMDVYFRTTYDDIAMPDPKAGRLAWLNLDEGSSSTDVGCKVSVVIAEPGRIYF